MNQTVHEIWLRNSTEGWTDSPRPSVFGWILVALGAGGLVLAAVAPDLSGSERFGMVLFCAVLISIGLPPRRTPREIVTVVEDGRSALAVPMRSIPLRFALLFAAMGAALLGGALVTGGRALLDGQLVAIVPMLLGGGLGLFLAVIGLGNLAPSARGPKPILVTQDDVTWRFGGRPVRARWKNVLAIEERTRQVGAGLVRPKANYLLIRCQDGGPQGWIHTGLIAADPAAVRDLLREHLSRSRSASD